MGAGGLSPPSPLTLTTDGTPVVSIFGVFRMPSLAIFGVIFGLYSKRRFVKLVTRLPIISGNLLNSGSTPVSMQECILILLSD